jgi:MoaA/NifB/PqqE/SkfB family radical SAM enzyme
MRKKTTMDWLGRAGVIARQGWRVADVVMSRHLRRAPRTIPILLMFMTNRCNLRCAMCGVSERMLPGEPEQELSTEEWKGVLRSAVTMRTSIISISGGEPLLRKDVFELIRYADERGLAVHICSNGMLLNRENVIRLRDAGVDTVSVSIESPTPEVHDRLRGPGSHERVVNGVRLLRELAPGVRVSINSVITRLNVDCLAEMVPFAESLGVGQIKFAPIHTNLLHREKAPEAFEGLMFGPEDVEGLRTAVDKLAQACARSRLLTTSQAFLRGVPDYYVRPRKFKCYAGYLACAVNPTGTVTPCCDLDSSLSVRDRPLDEIWRSAEFQALRAKVCRCESACWDTTNTEFSLRLRPTGLFRQFLQTWRDVGFYFGKADQ